MKIDMSEYYEEWALVSLAELLPRLNIPDHKKYETDLYVEEMDEKEIDIFFEYFDHELAEEGDDSDGGMGILMHTCTEAWRDLINVGSPSQQDEMKKARKNKVI